MMGKTMKDELKAALTKKERLNRNLLIACMLIGGALGIAMAFVEPSNATDDVLFFDNSPLPRSAAIGFALVWGVIVPAIAWYWHRNAIDEQESHAYREGAYYAFYAYAIGAPLWWVLWRGGLVPSPDGIVIYMTTMAVCGVGWFWKKYR